MSESSPPDPNENLDELQNCFIQVGNCLYKETVPLHSINIHKPRGKTGNTIPVTTAFACTAFKAQYLNIEFISIESWQFSFKVYLKSAENVKFLEKKKLNIDGQPCHIYTQEPIENGVAIHINHIPSTWTTDVVKNFFRNSEN